MHRLSLAALLLITSSAAAAPAAKLSFVSSQTTTSSPAVTTVSAWDAPVYARLELPAPLRATVEALPAQASRHLRLEWGFTRELEQGRTGAKAELLLTDAMLDARVLEIAVCDPAQQIALDLARETTPCWLFSWNDDLTRADASRPLATQLQVELPGGGSAITASLAVSLTGYDLEAAKAREKAAKQHAASAQAASRPVPAFALSKDRFKDPFLSTPHLRKAIFGDDKTVEVLRFVPTQAGHDTWFEERHPQTNQVVRAFGPTVGTVYKRKAEGACFVGKVQVVRYPGANKKLGAPQRVHAHFTDHAQIACDRLK